MDKEFQSISWVDDITSWMEDKKEKSDEIRDVEEMEKEVEFELNNLAVV